MMQEEKQKEIRSELEDLTRELVKLNDEADRLQVKIDKTNPVNQNAKLKELCTQQMVLQNTIKTKENRRNHLINLLNVIPR